MNLHRIRQAAIDIAYEAGTYIRQQFGKVQQVDFKGTVNPVTEVDKAVEALILSQLRATFPTHLIHSEEMNLKVMANQLSCHCEPMANSGLNGYNDMIVL